MATFVSSQATSSNGQPTHIGGARCASLDFTSGHSPGAGHKLSAGTLHIVTSTNEQNSNASGHQWKGKKRASDGAESLQKYYEPAGKTGEDP